MHVRDVLGYSQSSRFFPSGRLDDLPPNELSFALRLAVKESSKLGTAPSDVHFDGAYVLQREPQSPATPVVLLFQVATDTLARRIHQFVWNQNQAPFLIVETPSTVRLYPGFSFQHDGDRP